ncbi:MAG: XdhC family protein, partial [Candidatus Izemoplasmatales bacterium]|nr:XdhC family protein [Candidatus Izemoplasmatales bacterium]
MYRKILEFRAQGVPLVLITAVEKQGSGPVEVGKKMIVTNLGQYVGTVGGGTLEHYAINKAKSIFTTRKPLMERYALTEGEI